MLVHAPAIALAVDADGPLAGALLRGASGAGKSLLALAAIEDCPWRRTALIADDAAEIKVQAGLPVASARAPTRGLIEVRGFGPAAARSLASSPLAAAFDRGAPSERLPGAGLYSPGEGLSLPLYPFAPGEAGPARLRAAVRSILGGQTP